MFKPKISVIMAAKDREKFIGESIESYLDQNFKEFELIIINDHSTDKTLEIARSYQKNNPNIKVINMPDNSTGVSAARDFGIKKAISDIIAIGDSDDLAEKNRLHEINNAFENNPNCGCFYSNCKLLYQKDKKLVVRPFQPYNKELLKAINFIANSSSAFRKSAYEKSGGYDKNFIMSEDYDLWLTFIENKIKFTYSNKPLITIRIHDDSIRSNKRKLARSYLNKARNKHNIATPKIKDVKKIANQKYWDYINTPYGLKFWF